MSGTGSSASDEIPFAPPERFELRQKIGSGGMGVVYEAWDREHNVRVALKTGRTRDAEALVRFKREFRSLAEVAHRNLVGLYEMISTGEQWFFSMEYVEGEDFLSYVRGTRPPAAGEELATETVAGPRGSSPVSHHDAPPLTSQDQFARLRESLAQIVHGLDHLHSFGKLHCDVKPSNVFVTPDGRVVVLDFGLVHDTLRPLWDRKRQVTGTRGYMSPEQARAEPLTCATDWYAVGVMLFEAIHGCLPTSRSSIRRPGVPEDLIAICEGLLDSDPARRIGGTEVLEKLGVAYVQSARASVPQHEGATQLIGREKEMAALEESFRLTAAGTPAIVFLHGGSGMGKSELSRQFTARASAVAGTVVLTGRCYEQESVPFKAIDGLADMLGAFLKSTDPITAAACEPRDSFALSRIFPVLTHAAFTGAARDVEMDAVELRRRAFRAFRELLSRIADRKRLVLIIDDLQWGDLDSVALLKELLRPPDPPGLMVVLCYRTEDQGSPCVSTLRDARLPGICEIHLQPFDRETSLRLAREFLSREDVSWQARAEAIAEECGGSPYLALELAQNAAGSENSVSLDDMLWRRIEQLSGEARQFLEVVAVAGRSIYRKDAFNAAGLRSQDPGIISLLRGNRLVRAGAAGEDSVETYHDRIRETVTHRISPERLTGCHRSIALTLENSGSADPEQLAFHFDHAGDGSKALRYYVQGGDLAAKALAFDRAVSLYARSLELLGDAEHLENTSRRSILISLAESYANAGRGLEAARNYELAAERTAGTVEALSMRQKAAYQYCISGYIDEGRAMYRDVLKAVGQKLPPEGTRIIPLLLWSGLRMRLASLRYREPRPVPGAVTSRADAVWGAATGFGMVDLVGGAYFADRAAVEALRCGDPQRTLRALAWRACVIANRGLHTGPEVGKLLDACRKILKRHPSAYGEGMVAMAQGISDFHLDRKRLSIEHLLAAEDWFVKHCPGTHWERTTTRLFICFWLANHCQFGELERRVQGMLRDARDRGDRFTYAFIATGFAHKACLAAGRPAEARAIVSEAIDTWRQRGITAPRIYIMWASSSIHCYEEKWDALAEETERLTAEAKGSLLLRIHAFRLSFIAIRAFAAIGLAGLGIQREANLALAERESKQVLGMNTIVSRGFALGLISVIRFLKGDREGAIRSLSDAVQLLESDELAIYAMPMRLRLGQLTEGEAGLRQEQEAFQWLRAHGIAEPYRFALTQIPPMPGLSGRPPECAP